GVARARRRREAGKLLEGHRHGPVEALRDPAQAGAEADARARPEPDARSELPRDGIDVHPFGARVGAHGHRPAHTRRFRARCRPTRAGSRKRKMSATPATKPPMCAMYATPPSPAGASVDDTNCRRIQYPNIIHAGRGMSRMKKTRMNSVSTRARG